MDKIQRILVREIMTTEVVTIAPDEMLDQAVLLMRRVGCRRLPVVEDGTLVGIITDRDLRLAAESPYLANEPIDIFEHLKRIAVAEVMTRNPMTIEPDAPVVEAAQLMRLGPFGGLPVVEEETEMLVGIVTRSDLLDLLIRLLKPVSES